jgi:hypothetical protein
MRRDQAAGEAVPVEKVHEYPHEEPHKPLPKHLIGAYPEIVNKGVFGHFGDRLDEPL